MMEKVIEELLHEYELEEAQYFLKMQPRTKRVPGTWDSIVDKTKPNYGYLTKCNKDGSLPKLFKEWGYKLDTFLFKEEYRNGWKINGSRRAGRGDGVSWIELLHPEGFTVEIRGLDFVDLLKTIKTDNGLILNKCFYEARSKVLLVK